MGKKGKRTRWRTLTLNGQESDSESSSTAASFKFSKSYQPKYSKYSYSSQSTPTRKFQYEGKSTRSSSTASEQKITFNEDEYTRITTPRQDVLFKKGYLSKPKNYHTQTSTGTTCSTANSTSTCTPDHHSADGAEGTDVEYESQFVFPNVFVDQNGIYYVNTLEPFPFVVYNAAPAYYPPEYPTSKTKRYSTDSAVESASPQNEEAGNGSVTNGSGPEGSAIPTVPVFRQDFLPISAPVNCFYANGTSENEITKDQCQSPNDTRRLKKRRRKRLSTLQPSQEGPASSEHTDDCESDEVLSQSETGSNADPSTHESPPEEHAKEAITQNEIVYKKEANNACLETQVVPELSNGQQPPLIESNDCCNIRNGNQQEIEECEERLGTIVESNGNLSENLELLKEATEPSPLPENDISNGNMAETGPLSPCEDNILQHGADDIHSKTEVNVDCSQTYPAEEALEKNSFQLKPDAEEFVPRALRQPQHLPLDPALQFINLPPTYLPIPIISPLGSVPTTPQQSFAPVFLPPPGLPPLSFVPPPLDSKVVSTFPSIPGVVPQNLHVITQENEIVENNENNIQHEDSRKQCETNEVPSESQEEKGNTVAVQTNQIDIAQIVLKLEEAAKEQDVQNPQQSNYKSQSKFGRLYNGDSRQKVNSSVTTKGKPYNRRNEFSQRIYENNKKQIKPNGIQNQSPKRFTSNFTSLNNSPNKERRTFVQRNVTPTTTSKTPELNGLMQNTNKLSTESVCNEKLTQRNSHEMSTSVERNHNTAPTTNDQRQSQNVDSLPKQRPTNYSNNLKQQPSNPSSRNCPRFEKYAKRTERPFHYQKTNSRSSTPQKEYLKVVEDIPKKQSDSQNQWIAVSSRKKRRSKNMIDNSIEAEKSEIESNSKDDSFEAYDVNQLVDIIPKPSEDICSEKSLEKENAASDLTKDIEKIISVSDASSIQQLDDPIPSKTDKTLSSCSEIQGKQEIEETLLVAITRDAESFNIDERKGEKEPELDVEKKSKSSKEKMQNKNSKKPQKAFPRKIIVTDPAIIYVKPSTATITEINSEEEIITASITNGNIETLKEGATDSINAIVEEITTRSEDIVESVEELNANPMNNETEINKITEIRELNTESKIAAKSVEIPEKRAKKKKKKIASKTNLNKCQSAFNSNTKLNVDDPYNFLLEDIALEDSDNKTNEEISEELDRVIQRGMYSSLEQKIKTIKVTDTSEDQFFKTFNLSNFLQKRPAQNKPASIKISDLTSILKNRVFGEPKVSVEELQKVELNFSQIQLPNVEDPPQPSTSGSGFFLENPETSELIKNVTNNGVDVQFPPFFQLCSVEHIPVIKNKSSDKLKCKNKKKASLKSSDVSEQPVVEVVELGKNETSVKTEDSSKHSSSDVEFFREVKYNDGVNKQENEPREISSKNKDSEVSLENGKETLYPITEAVRQWMTKTRENTPDVEILKSPDTILKELINAESDSEMELTEKASILNSQSLQNGLSDDNKITADEDMMLFSAHDTWSLSPQTSIEEEDLLDCWDNEIPRNGEETNLVLKRKSVNPEGNKMNRTAKSCRGKCIDDDILEEYESKYGQNEDYLKLKAEIEEQRKLMNFPKHGNLPYRAICCNLM